MVDTLINKYLTWMKLVYSGKRCLPELTFLRKNNSTWILLGSSAQGDFKFKSVDATLLVSKS
jgi:hypothetical protein